MGGAERVALDLAYEQQKAGHEVVVLSLAEERGGPLAAAFEAAEIPVHHVPKRSGLDWSLPSRSARVLRQLGVQVAHTHNTRPLAYAAAAARLSGMVVIHSKHGEGHLVSRPGQVLRRISAPFANRFVSVSEATADHARAQKAYPFSGRMHVILNGIRMDRHRPDPGARTAIRKELGIASDAWVVGSVGRLDDNKNQSALVRAMEPLLGPESHLVLVGEGSSMAKVRAAAANTDYPDSVHILGRRDDAHRVVAALDVFALSSLSEGLPLVILEAMATGAAVVSTDVGGIADVVEDGKSGFLVPPGDDEAMRGKLQELAENRGLASQAGRLARDQVQERYSSERMARQYLELYRSELGAKS
jgi:glycosyltransferase involved in cell wall biosynthesis